MQHKWNIEFKNAALVYPNGKEALKNINLNIPEGQMVAIIGLSGAGKTSLLKTINKIALLTAGELYVGDRSNDAINDYQEQHHRFVKEQKKLTNFATDHKLNQKIIDSFIRDLNAEIQARNDANKDRQQNLKKMTNRLATLKVKYENTLSKHSKKIAQPIKYQIKQLKKQITYKKKRLDTKIKVAQTIDQTNNQIIGKLNNWQEHISEINIELEKRLKSRVKFFKRKYLMAKKAKPYHDVRALKGQEARRYKANIGMVFQRYNLIYKASVLNNVLAGRLSKMPYWRAITGWWSKKDKQIAFEALADVNILELAYNRAEDLSGGQMQRVALARTIAQGARLFLADEPVGALDPIMAKSVMDSFLEINQKTHRSVLLNLHHVDLALTYADRIIGVKDGQIVYDDQATKINLKVLKKIYGNKLEGFDEHELQEIMRKRKIIKAQHAIKSF